MNRITLREDSRIRNEFVYGEWGYIGPNAGFTWPTVPSRSKTHFHARLNARAKDFPGLNKNQLLRWINQCIEGHNAWVKVRKG